MKIELHDVKKRFGKVDALRGISATAAAGTRLALIGPNGSGKSTLLRAILGLVNVQGTLRVGGLDPVGDHAALARRLVYVPQVAPRLSIPVRDAVRVFAGVRGISPMAVHDVAERLDLDLTAVAKRLMRDLSGGMRQKLLVASALACPVELLVLDEPTASLDAEARQRFYSLLDDLPDSTSILLCSHRLEEVRQVTRDVWSLREGALEFAGSTDAFLAQAAMAIVDIRVDALPAESSSARELRDRGFRPGVDGWWRRVISQQDKVRTVRELTRQLNGSMRDLVVRDIEHLVVSPPAGSAPHPHQEGSSHA